MLSISLGLASPVWALRARNAGLEEPTDVTRQLDEKLQTGGIVSRAQAGLEEGARELAAGLVEWQEAARRQLDRFYGRERLNQARVLELAPGERFARFQKGKRYSPQKELLWRIQRIDSAIDFSAGIEHLDPSRTGNTERWREPGVREALRAVTGRWDYDLKDFEQSAMPRDLQRGRMDFSRLETELELPAGTGRELAEWIRSLACHGHGHYLCGDRSSFSVRRSTHVVHRGCARKQAVGCSWLDCREQQRAASGFACF